jgi:enoyl-CoA hydratase/carnithine racemase
MDQIQYDVAGAVATICFNRPGKKNALSLEMYAAFADAMERAHADDAVRAIVVTGAGNAFTSGNDISNFRAQTGREEGGAAERFMLSFVNSEKPLIAAVNGVAVGVGATLLLHCDLVYASEDARFRLPFVSLGICSEFASSLTLPAVMGLQRASELLLLAEDIDARKAFEYGFVNAVHRPGRVLQAALSAAQRIALQPVESVRATRSFLRAAVRPDITQRLIAERRQITRLLGSPDAQQSFEEFFARRATAEVARAA